MSKKKKSKFPTFGETTKATEPVVSAPPTPITQVVSWDDALKHMDSVRNQYLAFAGVKGYNPYFHIVSFITPLMLRYQGGERTEELKVSMLALDFTPPKV